MWCSINRYTYSVFALIHGTFNYALHERIIVSDEALRILEAAYAAYREQLAEEMRASGEYPDLPEQVYLLNADFGIELTMSKDAEMDANLVRTLRLEAQRPLEAEEMTPEIEETTDEEPLAWELPAQVDLRLTRTDIVDGVPVVSQAQIDGECEVLLRLWQDPLAPDALDEDSDYPYRYESIR